MSDAVARAAAIAAAAKDRESSVRERNRRDMPATAAFVDAFRIFGKLPAGRFKEAGRAVEWGKWSIFGTPVVASPPQILRDKRGRIIAKRA